MNRNFAYPSARKSDVVETYHGQAVPDPYRWLEEPDSEETRQYIEAQVELTDSYLAEIPARVQIKERLTQLWDYPKYSAPTRKGERYFFWKNDGLQNQAALYFQEGRAGEPRLLLDPNGLSDDGTTAVVGTTVSDDGHWLAYLIAVHGSDRTVVRVRQVETTEDLPEQLEHTKFASIAWVPDSSGFFYDRYPAGSDPDSLYKNNALYYHQLNTDQEDDSLVHADPDNPEYAFPAQISDDGDYIILRVWHAAILKNRLYYRKREHDVPFTRLIDEPDFFYAFLGNDGEIFYIHTDWQAPRGQVIAVDLNNPGREHWRTVLPESSDPIAFVGMVNDGFYVVRLHHARHAITLYDISGQVLRDVPLPGMGTIMGVAAKRKDREISFTYQSFLQPGTPYRYDIAADELGQLWDIPLAFDPNVYKTEQVFYQSKDGTTVPMFVTHRQGLARTGGSPDHFVWLRRVFDQYDPQFQPLNHSMDRCRRCLCRRQSTWRR